MRERKRGRKRIKLEGKYLEEKTFPEFFFFFFFVIFFLKKKKKKKKNLF